jgi:SAM-dependent methyltransferase
MIQQFQAKVDQFPAQARKRVKLIHTDAFLLPNLFPAEHFDVVVANTSLPYISDRDTILRHVGRALVPGGRAVLTSWGGWHRNPILAAMYDSLDDATAALASDAAPPHTADAEALFGLSDADLLRSEVSAVRDFSRVFIASAPATMGETAELSAAEQKEIVTETVELALRSVSHLLNVGQHAAFTTAFERRCRDLVRRDRLRAEALVCVAVKFDPS